MTTFDKILTALNHEVGTWRDVACVVLLALAIGSAIMMAGAMG